MSSEIFYDKAFIKVENKYIPLINQGSSNTFEIDPNGRKMPGKMWQNTNYTFKDRLIFTEEEIRSIAEAYNEISREDPGLMRKSRNKIFESGEFYYWFIDGIKDAHTVEEYTAYGNSVIIIDRSSDPWKKIQIKTTDELLKTIETLTSKNIFVSFENNRQVFRKHTQKEKR